MKLAFVSNFLNHHQLPICEEFQKLLGENFKFIVTEKIPEERIKLGYDDMNSAYDFVIRDYENREEAINFVLDSDVVIIGSAPSNYMKERLKTKKLTFRYSERIFKEGFILKTWLSLIKNITFKERHSYLLCSSAYSARDYNIALAYINRCYKWGYFPKVNKYNLKDLFKKKENKVTEILWVGRFITWKHPEKVVMLAKMLKNDGYKFNIKMVGTGEELDKIKEYVKKEKLNDVVELVGSVNNKLVRNYMESANIYLFTSDYNEGWGAVLNEAMNSACAVVTSHAIGSTPFLINHKENGLVYKDSDINDFYKQVKLLMDNKKLQIDLGKKAYNTMLQYWNPEYACKSFLELVDKLMNKEKAENSNQNIPCTKAKFNFQNRMYKNIMRQQYDKKNNK